MSAYQVNPTKSYTEKKAEHEPSGNSRVKCCSFDKSKTEYNYYRDQDCIKIFCRDLRDSAMKIINHGKKDITPLTKEEKESYEKQQICYICEEEFCTNKNKNKFKQNQKVRDHDHYTGTYRGAAHSICNLRYKVPKEIHVVFHNGSTYDYHFIIRQLAKEFKGNFDSLGENTEKYIIFSVPIKKELENGKVIIYKLKFIDSYRFMSTSLSSLIDNSTEINNTKEPENEFIINMRSIAALPSSHIIIYQRLIKKNLKKNLKINLLTT